MKVILIVMTIGIYLAAFGTIWMAEEQHRSNSGFFITPPMAGQQQFVQPTPTPNSMDLRIYPQSEPGVTLL